MPAPLSSTSESAQPPAANAGSPSKNILALIGWIALCFCPATTAAFVSVDGWYTQLQKPSWNPPSWVFGPAWTLLYLLMATAAWQVWCKGGWRVQGRALGWFLAQLALNALWTPLFFGMHRTGLAFAEIVLLWIAIAVTTYLFWGVRRSAGMLMIPYIAWVTFAAALNFTIWRLNANL